ncbi:MAG: hypothetical protein QW303_02390 [Nitrososphaerota archaeon]
MNLNIRNWSKQTNSNYNYLSRILGPPNVIDTSFEGYALWLDPFGAKEVKIVDGITSYIFITIKLKLELEQIQKLTNFLKKENIENVRYDCKRNLLTVRCKSLEECQTQFDIIYSFLKIPSFSNSFFSFIKSKIGGIIWNIQYFTQKEKLTNLYDESYISKTRKEDPRWRAGNISFVYDNESKINTIDRIYGTVEQRRVYPKWTNIFKYGILGIPKWEIK